MCLIALQEKHVYRHLPPEFWRAELGVDEATAPRALIIHGEWSARRLLGLAGSLLSDTRTVAGFLVVGRLQGVPVAMANVYGATFAADLTYIVVQAGARLVVQTGFFGSLSADMGTDCLLVPDRVVPEEGVARRFLRAGQIQTTEGASLRAALESVGGVEAGTLVSTGSIAAETDRLVARWVRAGHAGVDLESAATVAVARALGARAGVALHVIDNLVRGEHFQHPEVSGKELLTRRNERVEQMLSSVLAYAVEQVG